MAGIDSSAVFDGRMQAIGLQAVVAAAMRGRGWVSFATYAYSSSYQPSQSDDTEFKQKVLRVLLGDDFEASPESPKLRRLFFEAHTLCIADLRKKVDRPDSELPSRLPLEERVVRIATLRRRLAGVDISGPLEPSHKVIDILGQQLETGQLRYVAWEEYTTRDQEVHNIKRSPEMDGSVVVKDPAGFLRTTAVSPAMYADLDGNLSLQQMFARRAVAYELASLCTYEVFWGLGAKLIKELTRPAMEGYQKVTVAQLLAADRVAYTRLAELTASGLAKNLAGEYPLADAMVQVLRDSEFQFMLHQRPDLGKLSASRQLPIVPVAPIAPVPVPPEPPAGRVKGKGKGKEGGVLKTIKKRKTVTRTANGEPICFPFNRPVGCKDAKPGEKCSRGWHVCWMFGCGKPHTAKAHA